MIVLRVEIRTAQKIPVEPLYQVPFAERIKKEAGILTGAVGLITTATEAEQILVNQTGRPYYNGEAVIA